MYVLLCLFFIVLSEAIPSDAREEYDDEAPSAIQRKADVYPERFVGPVPFGHIPWEGIEDLFSPVKQPFDPLELDMVVPKNSEEENEMLKKGRKNIQFTKNTIPKGFASPRDKYLSEQIQPPDEKNGTGLKWYNLAEIQMRNAMRPNSMHKYHPKRIGPDKAMPELGRGDPKKQYFRSNSFQLQEDEIIKAKKLNWTTCDQFAVKAIFSPKDIVNYEWVPFYIWSIESHQYAIVHKFTYPTQKLVSEYRKKYGKFLNKTVDWSQTKLFMQGMTEMLLIAADKRGLFDAVIKHDIPDSANYIPITLPSLTIRLKIEDPYLVMTFCEDYFATVMAIAGRGPTIFKEMKAEASTINFIGSGQPVWRDFEAEKENKQLLREAAIREEDEKFIKFGPVPNINHFEQLKK